MNFIMSPFIVPVTIFLVGGIISVAGMVYAYQEKKLKVEQRMAALARGIPMSEIEKVFGAIEKAEDERIARDPLQSMKNARLTALILVLSGVGLAACCMLLSTILDVRQILAGAAVSLIPIAIGIGFWIDYRIQAREMERLGLVVKE